MDSALHANLDAVGHFDFNAKSHRSRAIVVDIEPRQVFRLLLVIIAILVGIGTVANIAIYHVAETPESPLARLMRRFDLGHEPSIPAWYSSIAILASSALLAIVAVGKRRQKDPYVWHWYGLSILFLGLALDESVMFHEMLHNVMHAIRSFHGILYFPWVIPGLLFCACVWGALFDFLRALEPAVRRQFLLSGAIFVSGAIGMEMVAGVIIDAEGVSSLKHTFSQAIEESLEMIGIALFIRAVLGYLLRNFGEVRFRETPL